MKKGKVFWGLIATLIATTLVTTGCNNTNSTASSESSETEKTSKDSIEGTWFSESSYSSSELTIDGEDAMLTTEYDAKVGTVDKTDKTITLKSSRNSEKVYTYKKIGEKLVLENEEGNELLTFSKDAVATSDSSISEENTDKKSTKTSSSEKAAGETKTSESAATEKVSAEKVYSDDYIEVTKEKNILSFKNLTQESIRLSGDATLNGEREINMYDFGIIGDIAASGIKTETVSKVKVEGIGDTSEKEAGETLGGSKLVYHDMKAGDSITWSGKIMNDNYETLAQISFTINY